MGGRSGRVQRGGVWLKNKGVSRGGAGGGPEAGGAERRGWARLGSARPGHHEPLQGVQVPAHRGPAAPQGGERCGTLPAVRYRGAGAAGPGLPAGGGGAAPVRRGSGSRCCRHRRYGGVVPGSRTRCPVTVRQRRPGGPSLAPTASRPDSLSRGALRLGAGGGPQPLPGAVQTPHPNPGAAPVQPVPLIWGTHPVAAGSRAVPLLLPGPGWAQLAQAVGPRFALPAVPAQLGTWPVLSTCRPGKHAP